MNPVLPSRGRQVAISNGQVTKIQNPDASRRERLRTMAGRKVAEETGLFVVPRILSFDDAGGVLVFERLELTGIRQALSAARGDPGLMEQVARSLGAIHGRMEGVQGAVATRWGSPAGEPERRPVPLHGDFGMRNVFRVAPDGRIAIIDWTNADWIGIEGDCGAPEIDVAVFLMSFFHRRLFGPWPVARRHDMARHFLMTYADAAPHGLDLRVLQAIVSDLRPAFTRMVQRRKGGLLALGSRHAMIDLAYFLRRLPRR